MSYCKNLGRDKQLKGVNGHSHLGQLLSRDFWSQIISCGMGGGVSECTRGESRAKIHLPVLDQLFPTCALGYTCATDVAEPSPCCLPILMAICPQSPADQQPPQKGCAQVDPQAQQRCGSLGRSLCGTNFNPRKVFPPVWQA